MVAQRNGHINWKNNGNDKYCLRGNGLRCCLVHWKADHFSLLMYVYSVIIYTFVLTSTQPQGLKLELSSPGLKLFRLTRLHSSRMHTARSLTVSPSILCSGSGGLSRGEGVPGGVPAWSRGGVVSQHALRLTPPVNRITDACENITLPQLRCGR